MDNSLGSTERRGDNGPASRPIILAYPRIYSRLVATTDPQEFALVFRKCSSLANNPPLTEAGRRHRGFFDLGSRCEGGSLGLYTVWSDTPTVPDIFIIMGPGDGFGPGHTCPPIPELQAGIYGDLRPVSLS